MPAYPAESHGYPAAQDAFAPNYGSSQHFRGSNIPPAQPGPGTYGRTMMNPQFHRTSQGPHQNPQPAPMSRSMVFNAEHQQTQQAHAQAVSSRIASTNAAIEAIQSVTPPVIQPVPRNRPHMELAGLPQLPGASIKGAIKFDHQQGVEVVDEVTAQRSASEFSQFLNTTRRKRKPQWDAFWKYRLDVNRQILLEENQCFKEAQEEAHEYEDSDENDAPRRLRPVSVPYIYYNIGSFDVVPPPPVLMPDPEAVSKRLQAQEAQNAQHEMQRQQQNQQIQAIHAQQMSARQRAAQHLKQYGRSY